MSGGSQHNPNGRQSQLGPGWSPLQLQVANFLARAPQVHMPSERGVTWHTPTPPPHLYHVPAPSPPDPLQAMKNASSNSVYRHTATPPELYRHTPTPPDKHMMRHTPSPGDVKAGAPLPQPDLYPHLGPSREKLRAEELLAYTRVGVDLSLSGVRAANGSPSPALSVRDAPTINSLIARAQPRHHHARVDALLERLAPAPAMAPAPSSPHSVIVHPRAQPTPSPPSSNEDSADSCGAPPGSKRKRKPERTLRVPSAPPPLMHPLPLARAHDPPPPGPPAQPPGLPVPPAPPAAASVPAAAAAPAAPAAPAEAPAPVPQPQKPPSPESRRSPEPEHPPVTQPTATATVAPEDTPKPIENGETPHMKANGPEKPATPPPPPPPARRKTRSGSGETIADIAAMIASGQPPPPPPPSVAPVTVDSLQSVLASPEPKVQPPPPPPPSVAPVTVDSLQSVLASPEPKVQPPPPPPPPVAPVTVDSLQSVLASPEPKVQPPPPPPPPVAPVTVDSLQSVLASPEPKVQPPPPPPPPVAPVTVDSLQSVLASPEPKVQPAPPPPPPVAPVTVDSLQSVLASPEPKVQPPPPPPPPVAPVTVDSLQSVLASPEPKVQPAPPPPPPVAPVTVDSLQSVLASPEPKVQPAPPPPPPVAPVTVDSLQSVLASPEPKKAEEPESRQSPVAEVAAEAAAAPGAEPARSPAAPRPKPGHSEHNAPVPSPEEGKPAETEPSEATTAEPTAASFVEVENQLEKMFAGIEEEPAADDHGDGASTQTAKAKKRRKSAPTKGERKAARRSSRASTDESGFRRKAARKKEAGKSKKTKPVKDAYDSGSNASSSRSRGPYIQIRGPRSSPLSVSVINAAAEEDDTTVRPRRAGHSPFRNGLRARGLHASTLGLRYDATTPDATWRCAFCDQGPHAKGLGDLFGPYSLDTDCEEYRALDEATRRRYPGPASEAWLHEACGVWAPGLVAAGARLWGLPAAVWGARAGRCAHCAAPPAPLACRAPACRARAHLPCARAAGWRLDLHTFRALCPQHRHRQEDVTRRAELL